SRGTRPAIPRDARTHCEPGMKITYEWRGAFDNAALDALHPAGFGHPVGRTDRRTRLRWPSPAGSAQGGTGCRLPPAGPANSIHVTGS
ncbi:hypothetical protein ACWET9_37965, partial [Streptomyces sp. NPDC004059]